MQQSIGAYDIVTELWLALLAAALGGAVVAVVAWSMGDRVTAVARRLPGIDRAGWVSLGALIVAYLAVIGRLSVQRHDAFKSHAYDLGIFTQVVWNTSQGRWFQNTVMIEYAENLLGQHFAPIFLVLAPLYWIWPDPRVLLTVQSLALALGALPVFLFARRRLRSDAVAVTMAATYLLLPALHYINFYDFHEIALTTPLLLFAIDFLDQRRWWPMVGALAVALLCREEVAILVAVFGVALLVQRRWAGGLTLIVVGAVWLAGAVLWLVPRFQDDSGSWYFVVRYGQLGNSIPEIVATIVTRPLWVWEYLTTGDRAVDRFAYTMRLLGPLGLTPLLGLPVLAMAAPTFGYLFLSDYREQYDIVNQYSAPLIPFLMAAAIVGIGWATGAPMQRFARWWPPLATWRPLGSGPARAGLAAYVLLASLAGTVAFGPSPIGRKFDHEQFEIKPHAETVRAFMALIPPDASVATQADLVPHLAHRRQIYLFPYVHAAEYILVDNWTDRWPLSDEQWNRIVFGELLTSPLYQRVRPDEDGVALFKRVDPPPIQHATWAAWEAARRPQYEIIGYDVNRDTAAPGEVVELGVYWRVVSPIGVRRNKRRDVTTVALIAPNGQTVATIDREPWGGIITTDRMLAGEVHFERYRFTIPPDAVPGPYRLDVGLYAYASKNRLGLVDETGQRTGGFLAPVTTVSVVARGDQ